MLSVFKRELKITCAVSVRILSLSYAIVFWWNAFCLRKRKKGKKLFWSVYVDPKRGGDYKPIYIYIPKKAKGSFE